MIILGIDPGIAIVGWGVVEYSGSKFRTLGYGSIQTPTQPHRVMNAPAAKGMPRVL